MWFGHKFANLNSKKLCEILPIDLKMFYLEHIYIKLDMKPNMFEFNLVHGEFF